MKYFKLLFSSAKVSLSNKILWLFGFIVVFISAISLVLSQWMDKNEERIYFLLKNSGFIEKNLGAVFLIALFGIILLLFAVWIATVSKISLVYCPYKMKNSGNVSLQESWSIGKSKFWKIFWFDALFSLAAYAGYEIVYNPLSVLFKKKLFILGIILLIFIAALSIFFLLMLFFIQTYGYRKVILENKDILRAISESYDLYLNNWKKSLIFLLVFVVSIFYSILLLFSLISLIFFPIFAILAFLILFNVIAFSAIAHFLWISFLPIAFLAAIFLIVFKQAFWTRVYCELSSPQL